LFAELQSQTDRVEAIQAGPQDDAGASDQGSATGGGSGRVRRNSPPLFEGLPH